MAYLDSDNLNAVLLDDDALRIRKLTRLRCGVSRVTSGRIVACDPMVQPDRQAFVRSVAPGSYAVDVLQDGSNALAVLWLRERPAAGTALRWEPALLADQAAEDLGDDEFYGYPVDAGLGCFMDAEALAAMTERERRHADEPHFNYYDSIIDGELNDKSFTDHSPLGTDAPNIVLFSSGWGDGSYPSYWGLGADGEPVALVTDFMIIKGGDARDEDDLRREAYLASLSPEKLAALEALGAAVSRGEPEPIRTLLAGGLAGVNDIIPSSGETALSEAIRLNQTESLRALLDGGPCPDMPSDLRMRKVSSYLEYAHVLKQPRHPALIALLEQAQPRGTPAGDTPPVGELPKKGFWKKLFS